MSKTITINNGGRYDDQSYTDERHYHYEGAPGKENHHEEQEGGAALLRVRLRLVEALLEHCGASTKTVDRIKLCRLMAFATGTSEGYVKKIFTERHVDTSADNCRGDLDKLRRLMDDADLALNI